MLENPTRYHVIQKQKNQVRQYLSESFQQSTGEWDASSAAAGNGGGSSGAQSMASGGGGDHHMMEYVSKDGGNKMRFLKFNLVFMLSLYLNY